MKRNVVVSFVLFCCLAWLACVAAGRPVSAAGPAISGISLSAASIPAYQKLEVTFGLSNSYSNPFDPAIIEVWAEVASPSGGAAIYVPGFFYQDYTIDSTNLKIVSSGSPVWKVRFTPEQTGTYSLVIKARDSGGTSVSSAYTFGVTAAAGDSSGFVQLDAAAPKYFKDSHTGKSFFAVGFNDDVNLLLRNSNNGNWSSGSRYIPPTIATGSQPYTINPYTMYNTYKANKDAIEAAAGNGANALRILADTYYFPLELPAGSSLRVDASTYKSGTDLGFAIGTYSKEMSWILDKLFELCEQNHVRVTLTTWNGLSSITDSAGASYAMGSGKSEDLIKSRLRYQMARWGYSTSYWTTNYFNEQESESMTDTFWTGIHSWLKNLDPYDHLISNSTNQTSDHVDFYVVHDYGADVVYRMTVPQNTLSPYVYEEFGKDGDMAYSASLSTNDPNGNYPRTGFFASLIAGNSGAMTWWVRPYYGPTQLHVESNMYKGISGFLAQENLISGSPWQKLTNQSNYTTSDFPSGGLLANNDKTKAFYWVMRTPPAELSDRTAVNGKWIKTPLAKSNNYETQWWNTTTGQWLNTVNAVWEGGYVVVNVPDGVTRDIAAKIVPIGARIIDNSSPTATYSGTWTHDSDANYFNGTKSVSNTTNSTAQFSFTGSSLQIYTRKDANLGKFDVYIDGNYEATVDTYSPTNEYRALAYQQSVNPGTHTVLIKLAGQKNASSSGYWIGLDDISYSPVTVDNNSVSVAYGGTWSHNSDSNYYNGTKSVSNTTGSTAQLSFTGTSVSIFAKQLSAGGKFDVYLDGTYDRTVDTYYASDHYQALVYHQSGLTPGAHTVRIQLAGQQNASSSGYFVGLDYFSYY
ncbi:MAG: DUF5060 domain-containing protein [Paenibacillaceae bacterium]|nr:DUF5060 domain-containing protein [Paenibacillaceae bacterium]